MKIIQMVKETQCTDSSVCPEKFPPQLRSLNAQVSVLDVIKQNCLTQLQSQRTTELKIQRTVFLDENNTLYTPIDRP